MSILRVTALSATVALSTATVCFVCSDRLAHPAYEQAPPMATIARLAPIEPATTGTIMQGPAIPVVVPTRTPSGFDTERLNALMRGETGPAARR